MGRRLEQRGLAADELRILYRELHGVRGVGGAAGKDLRIGDAAPRHTRGGSSAGCHARGQGTRRSRYS